MKRYHLLVATALALPLLSASACAQAIGMVATSADQGHPTAVSFAKTDLGTLYVDSRGMTLYALDTHSIGHPAVKFDENKYCSGPCAQIWIAVKALPGAKPVGDWKVVEGAEGPQWAYRNDPVFTYVGDKGPGTAAGRGRNDLWRFLPYVPPVPKITAPPGVIPAYVNQAYILEDSLGHALFASDKVCSTPCADWTPFMAGMASLGIGEWTVSREGDYPQWVYRGHRVYVSENTQAPAGADLLELEPALTKTAKTSEQVSANAK